MKFATTTTYLFSLLSFAAAAPAAMNSSTSSFEVINLPTEPTTGVVSKRQNDFWGVECEYPPSPQGTAFSHD